MIITKKIIQLRNNCTRTNSVNKRVKRKFIVEQVYIDHSRRKLQDTDVLRIRIRRPRDINWVNFAVSDYGPVIDTNNVCVNSRQHFFFIRYINAKFDSRVFFIFLRNITLKKEKLLDLFTTYFIILYAFTMSKV